MAAKQEHPVEIYYISPDRVGDWILCLGFKDLESALKVAPDLLTNPNWIDVHGDMTRFEPRAVYNYLRDIEEKPKPEGV